MGGLVASWAYLIVAATLPLGLATAESSEARLTADAPVKLVGEALVQGASLGLVLTHPGDDGLPGLDLSGQILNGRITHYQYTRLCTARTDTCQPHGPPDRSEHMFATAQLRAYGERASPALVVAKANDRITGPWPTAVRSSAGAGDPGLGLVVVAPEGAELAPIEDDVTVKATDGSGYDGLASNTFAEFDAGTLALSDVSRSHAIIDGPVRLGFFGVRVDVSGLVPDGTASPTSSWSTGFRNDTTGPAGALETRRFSYVIVEGLARGLTLDTTMATEVYAAVLEATYEASEGLELDDAEGSAPGEGGLEKVKGDLVIGGRMAFVAEAYDRSEERLSLRFVEADAAPRLETSEAVPYSGDPRDATLGLAASAVAASGLLAAAFYWPFLKHALGSPLIAALYTRIGRDEVLEHGKREEIYELIRANPGIHAHDVSAKAGIGWGTTVYHLKLLEDNRLVVSRRLGRYKRFYLNAGHITQNKDAYAVLRNETGAALARAVRSSPGVIQKELCSTLGITPSLVSWHMDKLEGAGLVKKVKEGRIVRYYAGPAWDGLEIPAEGNT